MGDSAGGGGGTARSGTRCADSPNLPPWSQAGRRHPLARSGRRASARLDLGIPFRSRAVSWAAPSRVSFGPRKSFRDPQERASPASIFSRGRRVHRVRHPHLRSPSPSSHDAPTDRLPGAVLPALPRHRPATPRSRRPSRDRPADDPRGHGGSRRPDPRVPRPRCPRPRDRRSDRDRVLVGGHAHLRGRGPDLPHGAPAGGRPRGRPRHGAGRHAAPVPRRACIALPLSGGAYGDPRSRRSGARQAVARDHQER